MAGRQVPPLLRFIRAIGPAASDEDTADGELLARFVRQRDEAAFTTLFRRHGPMVWNVCRRVLADSDGAEDAFQATFLVFLRKAGSITRPELLANYLYGIACRTAAKAKALRARRQIREEQGSVEVATADNGGEADWRELRPVLDEELRRLPEKYRAPLVLCYLEGKTYVEAARTLGWAEGTVSGRLARARDLLRGRLIRRGLVLSAGSLVALLVREATAAIPTGVGETTFQAVAGNVSPQVAALSKGVLHAMFLSKLQIAGTVLLAVTLVGAGAGVASHRVLAANRSTMSDGSAAVPVTPAAPVKEEADETKDKSPSATSPDGQLVAKGNEKAVGLFDADSRKELRRLVVHKDKVTALAFTPDGKCLVSGSRDKTVVLWDVATGKILWKNEGKKAIAAVKFSEDGRSLTVEEEGKTKRTLESATGKEISNGPKR